jgi:hypothetical protein
MTYVRVAKGKNAKGKKRKPSRDRDDGGLIRAG